MTTQRPDPGELTARQQHILDFVQHFQGEHSYPPSMREIGEHFGIRSTNGVSDHLRALQRKGFLQRSGHLSRSLTVVKNTPELERITERLTEPVVTPGPARVAPAPQLQAEPPLPANVRTLPPPAMRRGVAGDRLIRRDQPSGRHHDPHRHDTETTARVPVLGRVAAGQPLLAIEDAEETLVVDQYLLGGPGEVFALRVVGESMIEAGILPSDYLFVRKRDTARSGEIVVAMLDGEATVKRYFLEGDRIRLQPENSTMQPIYVRRGDVQQCQIVGVVVGVYRRM